MKKLFAIILSAILIALVIWSRIDSGEFDWLLKNFRKSRAINESFLVGKWNIDNVSGGYVFYDELVESVSSDNTGVTIFNKDKTGKTITFEDNDTIYFKWELDKDVLILTANDSQISSIIKRVDKNRIYKLMAFQHPIKDQTMYIERYLSKIE